jgi:hypothetical protein
VVYSGTPRNIEKYPYIRECLGIDDSPLNEIKDDISKQSDFQNLATLPTHVGIG